MDKYTELEKQAQKFLDETDTMQFSTFELLTMFYNHQEQLTLTDVGCSTIHSPYLTSEKKYQLKKMEELGINTKCCTFEQSVNGLIYMLEEYKESE